MIYINIKEVARLAGVSHTTVSRVLNDPKKVKKETYDQVLKVINDYNFVPSTFARSMTNGRKYAIGLLVFYDMSQFPSEFFSSVFAGIVSVINQEGYMLNISFGLDPRAENKSNDYINDNRIDGLFVLAMDTQKQELSLLKKANIPFISVNQKIEDSKFSYVVADDFGGAYSAVKHLMDTGRRKIAYINGTPGFETSEERHRGYLQALQDNQVPYFPYLDVIGNFDSDTAYSMVSQLLEAHPDLDAIFAANDIMALGAMRAVKSHGLSIPKDVAIVGFDNQVFADCVDPPLTTVEKPRYEMGRRAAEMMLAHINSSDFNKREELVLPTRLIVRQSS